MDFKSLFQQTNAYAMQFGILQGLLWIGGFLAFVNSFSMPGLQSVYLFCTLIIPISGWQLTRTFRKRACDNVMSFGRGYLFSFLLYFYAAILQTAAFYIYFAYFDQGHFVDSYLNYLEQPEVKALLETPEMQQTVSSMLDGNSLTDSIEVFQQIPLIALTLNVLNVAVVFGALLSLPTALLNIRSPKKNY